MPAGPSEGWLQKIFGSKEKETPNQKTEKKRRRKDAVKKAFTGYERTGGLWGKIQKGYEQAKKLVKD